jgi:hypothetical protein
MRTLHCHERLGEQKCESETVPQRDRPITRPDQTTEVHHECEKGHKFHLTANEQRSACDCP